MFGKLNISVFYPLYKEFYIWSNEVSLFNFVIANVSTCIYVSHTNNIILYIEWFLKKRNFYVRSVLQVFSSNAHYLSRCIWFLLNISMGNNFSTILISVPFRLPDELH